MTTKRWLLTTQSSRTGARLLEVRHKEMDFFQCKIYRHFKSLLKIYRQIDINKLSCIFLQFCFLFHDTNFMEISWLFPSNVFVSATFFSRWLGWYLTSSVWLIAQLLSFSRDRSCFCKRTPGRWAGIHFGWPSGSVHGSVQVYPGFGGSRSRPPDMGSGKPAFMSGVLTGSPQASRWGIPPPRF